VKKLLLTVLLAMGWVGVASAHPHPRTPSAGVAGKGVSLGATVDNSTWAPNQIKGLVLWLDASDRTTLTLSGTSISAWKDKSGQGNNATQVVASSQPTFGPRLINGKPVVNFDGVSQWLMVQNIVTSANTVIVVFRATTTATSDFNGLITCRNDANANKLSAGTILSGWTVRPANDAICGLNQTSLATYSNGVAVSAANFDNFAVGVAMTQSLVIPNWFADMDDNTSGTQNFAIGTDVFGTGRFWPGEIAEVLIFNQALDASSMALLRGYFKRQWGTP
jgi:hypothetical protein